MGSILCKKQIEEKLQDFKQKEIKPPRILENLIPYGKFSHNYQGLAPKDAIKPKIT